MGLLDRAVGVLERVASRRFAPALGLLLLAPALLGPPAIDDHMHALALAPGEKEPCYPLSGRDLFAFVPRDPYCVRYLMGIGILPWWTWPDVNLAFYRPVTTLTHVLDHRLWPAQTWAMHLQSLLWYAAVVALVGVAFRRLLPSTSAAGLGVLLYALDDAHAIPAGWIANRNALVAAVFGLLSLLAHVRSRRGGGIFWSIASVTALLASVLSAEGGVATTAYLFAFAVALDRGPLLRRLAALLPHAAVVVLWRAAYRALGYGISGSDLYIDPGESPLGFVATAAERLPVLLFSTLGPQMADAWIVMPDALRLPALAVVLGTLAILGAALRPALAADAGARFCGIGMVLAAIPICAALTSDRLLTFTAIGSLGLVACAIAGGHLARGWRRGVLAAFLLFHAVLGPLSMPARSYAMGFFGKSIDGIMERVGTDAEVGGRTVVFVNTPTDFVSSYLTVLRFAQHRPLPAHVRTLCIGVGPVRLTRTGPGTLVARRESGFFTMAIERLCRDRRHPMEAGYRVELPGFAARVMELTPDGFPREVEFTFDVPLEDPSLHWVAWTDRPGGRWMPPAIGASADIPAISLGRILEPSTGGAP